MKTACSIDTIRPIQMFAKTLFASLALFIAVVAPLGAAQAESPSSPIDWKVSGSARLRFEDVQWYGSATNPLSFSRTDFYSLRVRPTIEGSVEEGLRLVLTPQFAKVLGRDYSYTLTDSSGAMGYNENLHMHEAYLQWTLSSHWSLAAGRMILSYGDQLILAAGEWPLTGRSFDGAKVKYLDDLLGVDLFALKIDSAKDLSGSDRDLIGIHTRWNVSDAFKAFEIYGLYESNQQNAANESRHIAGIRIVAQVNDAFDASAEQAFQRGTTSFLADSGYQNMVVASAGWKATEFYQLRVGLEFNQADRDWRDWYPLLKGPLGRNEVVGRRNLSGTAIRVSAQPFEKLKLKLDYWLYKRVDRQNPIYRPQDAISVGTAGGATSDDVGEAVDLAFTYKSSDRVEYGVGGTAFFPGGYLVQQFQENRIMSDFYAVANITF